MIIPQMKTSIKKIAILLFIIINLYFWVLIPATRVCLTPMLGQDTAESIALSMTILKPVDVFFSLNIPNNLFGGILYYINRASELIAFTASFLIIMKIGKHKVTFILMSMAITTVLISGLLAALVRKDFLGGVIPSLAAASGVAVAVIAMTLKKKVNC